MRRFHAHPGRVKPRRHLHGGLAGRSALWPGRCVAIRLQRNGGDASRCAADRLRRSGMVRCPCRDRRIRLQVDVAMQCRCVHADMRPRGAIAADRIEAQMQTLRHRIPADTYRPAERPSDRHGQILNLRTWCGTHTYRQPPSTGRDASAPPGRRLAAWRHYHGNAHADRCAPLGRNPGGGPQGKPD